MKAGTVYGGYYGAKSYESVRKEENRTYAGRKKKAGQKELLEEYLEQQAQARRKQKELLDEKAAKAVQEQSRLSKAWSSKQQLSESEEMELFKKEFYEDLSRITIHKTLNNVAVNISEAGFRAMKEDPEYREKILSLLKRDLGSSLAPRNCSAVFTVGAAINEYRGDSWPVGYDEEFYARSKDSFFKKTSEKKDRQKELMEKYLEKRARTKKMQVLQKEKHGYI